MSNIILPDNLSELPLLDKELHYISPSRMLTPDNIGVLMMHQTPSTKLRFNLGSLIKQESCYSRFDLTDFRYNIKPNPVYNILPDINPILEDFNEITDARAIELEKKAMAFDTVYLFWSGGVDSTLLLCAVLKNCTATFCSKIIVVLNKYSIDEFPEMYQTYICGKLKEVSTDDFLSEILRPTNKAIYANGDAGDAILGYENIIKFNDYRPRIFNESWRRHKDTIISYFSQFSNETISKMVMNYIEESLALAKIEVETVYDFLWWISFNWGYDGELYSRWWFGVMPDELDARKFMEENLFVFFNSKAYQNWSVAAIGADLKIGDSLASFKKPAKQYIFEFTKEMNYFLNKVKEASVIKNQQIYKFRRLVAVDTDYNFYYGTPPPAIWIPK